ncbi:hypothetical protein A2477_02395 [Candidatus Falkowbacteria bacterium RIFOXYC2_FULL_47_12]|uniref:Uncharacterized protein n=1 Tax=Candidatus Falkowbacteria bacterium RIFOXYC2_FULL_47_12 TaxID=1798004 RepID=A0A1F5TNP9_9BACT|nr:MAG: hypothetical protein A2477_02395 [Candidatus Falkowbacteria bacterium RIFOXYC2_FULL_47_12]
MVSLICSNTFNLYICIKFVICKKNFYAKKNIPAKRAPGQKKARFSQAHEHQKRPYGFETPAAEGAQAAL